MLIKTSESEVVGQGYQKLMLNVKGLVSDFAVSNEGEIMTAYLKYKVKTSITI